MEQPTEIPLTPTQRAMRAARLVEKGGISSAQAARDFAANDTEVSHAKLVMATGVPELIAMLDRGELSLYMGRKISLLPADQQRATLERVRTEKILDSVDRRVLAKAMDKVPLPAPKKPRAPRAKWHDTRANIRRNKRIAARVENCIEQMKNTVEILGEFLAEGAKIEHPDMGGWLDNARKVRRSLTRILKAHKIEEEEENGQQQTVEL